MLATLAALTPTVDAAPTGRSGRGGGSGEHVGEHSNPHPPIKEVSPVKEAAPTSTATHTAESSTTSATASTNAAHTSPSALGQGSFAQVQRQQSQNQPFQQPLTQLTPSYVPSPHTLGAARFSSEHWKNPKPKVTRNNINETQVGRHAAFNRRVFSEAAPLSSAQVTTAYRMLDGRPIAHWKANQTARTEVKNFENRLSELPPNRKISSSQKTEDINYVEYKPHNGAPPQSTVRAYREGQHGQNGQAPVPNHSGPTYASRHNGDNIKSLGLPKAQAATLPREPFARIQ
jgi:hypothetical protein